MRDYANQLNFLLASNAFARRPHFFARYAFYRYVFFFCPFSQSWSTLLLVLSSRVVPGNVLLFRRFMRLTVSSRCY